MKTITLLFLLTAAVAPTLAWWKQSCKTIVVERGDPIKNPGNISAHVHNVMGGSAFGLSLAPGELAASKCTTCLIQQDKSAYWVPQLYFQTSDGRFISVNQTGEITISTQQTGNPGETIYPFPENFRMVTGDPTSRSYNTSLRQLAITFDCLNNSGPALPSTYTFPNYNCPDGLQANVGFPQCSNGSIDSADHRSHMAYPSEVDHGDCPPTHPMRMLYLRYQVVWDTGVFASQWNGTDQPFVWSMGDPTGYGSHSDFYNGWDIPVLQTAIQECNSTTGAPEDCNVFDLIHDVQCDLEKPPLNETVLGNLDKLPGCNPVTRIPGPPPNCTLVPSE